MPTINITYSIDFEDDEIAALAEAIGFQDIEVEQRVQSFAKAALREYADMMIGEAPLSSNSHELRRTFDGHSVRWKPRDGRSRGAIRDLTSGYHESD